MKIFFYSALIAVVIILIPHLSFGQEENLSLLVESKYFSVYAYPDLDINTLLAKLNFIYFFHPDTLAASNSSDPKTILANTLDSIYLEVSDILDIHLYSLHTNIKIFPDKSYIAPLFKKYSNIGCTERSCYLNDSNTIYISSADLTLGMLGHEIAHSLISHYFVVPPPAKIQEVLCGYVEYNLRKSTSTLP